MRQCRMFREAQVLPALSHSNMFGLRQGFDCSTAKNAAGRTYQRHDGFLRARRDIHSQRDGRRNDMCERVHHIHDLLHIGIEAPT